MNSIKFVVVGLALLSLGISSYGAENGEKANIVIDAASVIGNVQPGVFGQNIEAADQFGTYTKVHQYGPARTGSGVWNPESRAFVPEAIEISKNVGMKMLRYPGGCLTHNFNWKDAVGKPEDRPNYSFGIDEYIAFCKKTGAEPLMNVSAYTGTPQDAAELVEYLNAPADAAHPWAQKRALWGHPEPYSVRYFEMGNESDHGNHAVGQVIPYKKYTAKQYAQWFNTCARLMRAVDPTIKIGGLMGTGTGPDDPWNKIVLEGLKDSADFIVVHTYAIGVWAQSYVDNVPQDRMMRASMAASGHLEIVLKKYRSKIRQYTGKDIPLAITEYNAAFVQDNPVPYRFSLGAALFSADYIRVLLQPDSNVLMANYWQIYNGYWGMVRKTKDDSGKEIWKKRPAYYLFRLWGQHFGGTRLVSTQVSSPRLPFEGFRYVPPMHGAEYLDEKVLSDQNLLKPQDLKTSTGPGYATAITQGGILRAELSQMKGEYYVHIATIHSAPGTGYQISFEGRSQGLDKANVGLGMADTRGWDKTQSAIAVEGVQKAHDWKKFEKRFSTLPDAKGVEIVWRLRSKQPVTGKLEIRNLKILPMRSETFPAYPVITSISSLSADGKKLYVMVFNKHDKDDIATTINLKNFPVKTARYWTVDGPSLASTNMKSEEVKETETAAPLTISGDSITHIFPAHSMTALEFTR